MCFKKILWLIAALLFLNVCSASAEDFTVSSVNDLQDALTAASSNGKNNTITIEPGTYFINSPLTYIYPGQTDLTISGISADSVILDG
jgi:hypothetical protein